MIKLPLDVIHGLMHYFSNNGVVRSIKSIVLCNSSSNFFGACLIKQTVINQEGTTWVYFLDMYLLKVFKRTQVSNNTIYIINLNYIDGLVLQERLWPVNVIIPFSALFKKQSNPLITHLHGIKSIESNNTNYSLPIGISLKEYYSLFIKNIIEIIINF